MENTSKLFACRPANYHQQPMIVTQQVLVFRVSINVMYVSTKLYAGFPVRLQCL